MSSDRNSKAVKNENHEHFAPPYALPAVFSGAFEPGMGSGLK